jgi:hypothetical protein
MVSNVPSSLPTHRLPQPYGTHYAYSRVKQQLHHCLMAILLLLQTAPSIHCYLAM